MLQDDENDTQKDNGSSLQMKYLQLHKTEDLSPEKEQEYPSSQISPRSETGSTSGGLSLPKSPVKRMRKLEAEQNKQDQEDVETTF